MGRQVHVFIGKGTWILRATAAPAPAPAPTAAAAAAPPPDSGVGHGNEPRERGRERDGAQLLETGFTGVAADFTYTTDGSISSSFELQVRT